MALFWRLWAAVTLVNLAVLAVFIGLATLQFGRVHEELLGERLTVLADRAADPLEAAAAIGLPLSAVRTTGALLERARQSDGMIAAIHVFDHSGAIVHSTASDPPRSIPAAAAAARVAAGGESWFVKLDGAFLGGVDIAGLGGEAAGGVLVVYPTAGSVTRIQAMAAELTLAAIVTLAVAAALGAVLLRLGIARQIRFFDSIDEAVVRSERDSWRAAAGGAPEPAASPDAESLRGLLDLTEARYRRAGCEIAALRATDGA